MYKGQIVQTEKTGDYLRKQKLSEITGEQRSILNGSIMVREVVEAINEIKPGKVLGLDRTGSYCRCFEDERILPTQATMNSILQSSKIRDSWKER